MNFITELFLAWRYFKPKRNAVSIITLISVIGVSLGVCVLMVVLSIMTGFTDEIKTKLLDINPHISIRNSYKEYIDVPEKIIKKVDSLGAKAIPITYGEVLVQKGDKVLPQSLIGIDAKEEPKNDFIAKGLIAGRASLNTPGDILVSYVLANKLGLHPGTKILIHSPARLKDMVDIADSGQISKKKDKEVYLPAEFIVSGVFSVGDYNYDSKTIITALDDADDLFGYPWGAATMISVKTEDPFDINPIYEKISKAFPGYQILTWKQTNKQFLNVLAVEKNMMFFVLIFIVLVAASSITNTLITVVVQKTREIGLLRALGASPATVMRIFILQGFFVGFIGTAFGLLLGGIVIYYRMAILYILSTIFHIEIFPREFYMLSELPASVVPRDIIFIVLCTIILCTLGAIIPAYRAAKLDPAKALRYE
jgi:lipoprotein-releasing system permease protein